MKNNNMPVLLIALSGKSKSGKSTVAQVIRKIMKNKAKVLILSIAGILKQDCMKEYNLSVAQVKDAEKDCRMTLSLVVDGYVCETPRQVLQRHGQAIRKIDPNYWIDKALKNIKTAVKNYDIIIVDDLRFHNEAQKLKQEHAILIRLSRDSQSYIKDISETELDNYDKFDYHFINNSRDMQVLEQQLRHTAFVRELLDIYGRENDSNKA